MLWTDAYLFLTPLWAREKKYSFVSKFYLKVLCTRADTPKQLSSPQVRMERLYEKPHEITQLRMTEATRS